MATKKHVEPKPEKPAAKAPSFLAPSVYRSRGYLSLVLSFDEERDSVEYLSPSLGGLSVCRESKESFLREFNSTSLSPAAFALNLIGRFCDGCLTDMSVRVYRRLEAMLSKEELMQMSEKAFAKEYSRVMGLAKPVTKISKNPETRMVYVNDLLSRVGEAVSVQSNEPAAATQATTTEGEAMKASKKPTAAKKGNAPMRKPADAEKKKGRSLTTSVISAAPGVANPYRDGSMKNAAFELYKKGGERHAIKDAVEKLGATPSTAQTWLAMFHAVVSTGKQHDWQGKRTPVEKKEGTAKPKAAAKKKTDEKPKAAKKTAAKKGAKKPAKK